MKFYCKPTLTLFLLLYVAIQSAQAQDTLRITGSADFPGW